MEINIQLPNTTYLCPYCLGTGKQLAMQMGINSKGIPERTIDTQVKCSNCKGKGFIIRKR